MRIHYIFVLYCLLLFPSLCDSTKDEECGDGYYVDKDITSSEICTSCHSLCSLDPVRAFKTYQTCTGNVKCIKWLKHKCQKGYIYDPLLDHCDVCSKGCRDEFTDTKLQPCRVLCSKHHRIRKEHKKHGEHRKRQQVDQHTTLALRASIATTGTKTKNETDSNYTVISIGITISLVILGAVVMVSSIFVRRRVIVGGSRKSKQCIYTETPIPLDQRAELVTGASRPNYGSIELNSIERSESQEQLLLFGTQPQHTEVYPRVEDGESETAILVFSKVDSGPSILKSLSTDRLASDKYLEDMNKDFFMLLEQLKIEFITQTNTSNNPYSSYSSVDSYVPNAYTVAHQGSDRLNFPKRSFGTVKSRGTDSYAEQSRHSVNIYNDTTYSVQLDTPNYSFKRKDSDSLDSHGRCSTQSTVSDYDFRETHFLSNQADAAAALNSLPPEAKPHIKNEREHSQGTANEITRLPTKLKPIPNVQTVLQTLALNTWIKRMISNGKFIRIWFGGIGEINAKRIVSDITNLREEHFDCVYI